MKVTKLILDTYNAISSWIDIDSNSNLVTGVNYLVDSSTSQLTLTIPDGTKKAGDQIILRDVNGSFDTNNIILTSMFNIMGSNDDYILNTKDSIYILIYVDSDYGWQVIENKADYIENIEIDDSNLHDGYVIKYFSADNKFKFVPRSPVSTVPVLSGPSSVTEQTDAIINIINYDPSNIYDVTIPVGSYIRTGGTITWSLPDVSEDCSYEMNVSSTVPGHSANVTDFSLVVTSLPEMFGDSNGKELATMNINIVNYQPTYNYDIAVTGGNAVRTDGTISWTLPEVTDDENHTLTLTSTGLGDPTQNTYQVTVKDTASVSGPANATENAVATITIDDYDASKYTYDITVTGGNAVRTDESISWTLPEVITDTTHTLTVTQHETGFPDLDTTHDILVENIPVVADTALLVENSGFDDFIEEGENYSMEPDGVKATSDTAWAMTKPELQESGDGDYGQSKPEIDVLFDTRTVDVSGSTVSSLKVSGVGFTTSDDVLLVNGNNSIVNMDNNISGVVENSGDEITNMGSETVFNSGYTIYISVTKLDDTHVCIAYRDDGNSYYGTAIVGTISGNSITFGSETVFNTGTTYNISVTKLDDTHVCIAYQDNSNSYYGTAIIGTISGNSITFGSETVFNTGTTQYTSITKLDDTHVCIAYSDYGNSYYGTVIIGTISGNSITFGSETVFNAGTTYDISITKLDDTHVCIAYQDVSNSSYGTVIIGTISGNSITFGSETVFNTGTTQYISITKLDDIHVCITYQDVSNSSYGTVIIGTISGNSITFGSETVFNSGNTIYISVIKLDDTHVCIAYQDVSNSSYGTAIVGTISGNSITFGSETVFNSGNTYYISITTLDDTHVCIAYEDSSNSDYGTAIMLERPYDSTLSLTNPLSEVPVKVLLDNDMEFHSSIGTETEYIPYEDIELTDLTNVTTTGLTGSSTFDNLWVSGGYHNKITLIVNGFSVETDVLSVSKSGSGPYTYDITYNTQTNVPTAAFKLAVLADVSTKLIPETITYSDISNKVTFEYPLQSYAIIPNIRQLKYAIDFNHSNTILSKISTEIWKNN